MEENKPSPVSCHILKHNSVIKKPILTLSSFMLCQVDRDFSIRQNQSIELRSRLLYTWHTQGNRQTLLLKGVIYTQVFSLLLVFRSIPNQMLPVSSPFTNRKWQLTVPIDTSWSLNSQVRCNLGPLNRRRTLLLQQQPHNIQEKPTLSLKSKVYYIFSQCVQRLNDQYSICLIINLKVWI